MPSLTLLNDVYQEVSKRTTAQRILLSQLKQQAIKQSIGEVDTPSQFSSSFVPPTSDSSAVVVDSSNSNQSSNGITVESINKPSVDSSLNRRVINIGKVSIHNLKIFFLCVIF